jgi:hypothetical protein
MLHIVYRSYGGENAKGRPIYYSKSLALASVIRAAEQLGPAAQITFLNDGPIPAPLLRIMESHGEVEARAKLGVRGSLRAALALPVERGWAKQDLVWFSEDDYLYQPHAFTGLVGAASAFPEAAYFGLYASIGTRLPNGSRSDAKHVPPGCTPLPRTWQDSEPRSVLGHPWRRALSTTSTFGARVGPLEQERRMMYAAMWSGGAWDYTTCLLYQGHQPFMLAATAQWLLDKHSTQDWTRKLAVCAVRVGLSGYQAARSLGGHTGQLFFAPDPALATHLESAHLALGTDWSAVAQDTQRWASERGFK